MDAAASTSLWVTLGLLIALGFRHGLDPDHIAAVDGLTRMRFRASVQDQPPAFGVARLAGFQFACGHSLNIFLVTLVFYWQDFELPHWLESTGLWLSTFFLLWLAVANLRQCWRGHPHTHASGPAQRLIMKIFGPLARKRGKIFPSQGPRTHLGPAPPGERFRPDPPRSGWVGGHPDPPGVLKRSLIWKHRQQQFEDNNRCKFCLQSVVF
jgi:hypothetical protein